MRICIWVGEQARLRGEGEGQPRRARSSARLTHLTQLVAKGGAAGMDGGAQPLLRVVV